MRRVVLDIVDESKSELLINFLREVNFVKIEEDQSPLPRIKKMQKLPQSMLSPTRVQHVTVFTREELHERTGVY